MLKQQVHLTPSGHAECTLRTPHRFYADIFLNIAPATTAAFNAARVGTIRTLPVPGGVGYLASELLDELPSLMAAVGADACTPSDRSV